MQQWTNVRLRSPNKTRPPLSPFPGPHRHLLPSTVAPTDRQHQLLPTPPTHPAATSSIACHTNLESLVLSMPQFHHLQLYYQCMSHQLVIRSSCSTTHYLQLASAAVCQPIQPVALPHHFPPPPSSSASIAWHDGRRSPHFSARLTHNVHHTKRRHFLPHSTIN